MSLKSRTRISLKRLQSATHGKAWKEGGRKLSEVLGRNEKTAEGSQVLWEFAKEHLRTR